MTKYKIAGVVFSAEFKSPQLIKLCQNYEYLGDIPEEFTLTIDKKDLQLEHAKNPDLSFSAVESYLAYSKFNEYLISSGKGLLFHSTAIAVDGNACLFTADSGVGKSTHAKFWRELLGDKVVMINDDKPVLTIENGVVYANGTPWQGKHKIGNNIKVPVKAICKLERGEKDQIESCSISEMIITILRQTILPKTQEDMDEFFKFMEVILKNVSLYKLKCTKNVSSACLAYETILGEKL
ncbi:MAG: hypothetical protein IKA12_03835 [Clostridia bacterium]|nr:hypothetical protein [Clostridia bacterium]